jgi:hypothetical protein
MHTSGRINGEYDSVALDSHKLHSCFLQGDYWFTLDILKRESQLSHLTGVSDDQSDGLNKPPD